MVSTRSQARLYDIPIARAPAEIDPVRSMASRRSAFPGPRAIVSPRLSRQRGRASQTSRRLVAVLCFMSIVFRDIQSGYPAVTTAVYRKTGGPEMQVAHRLRTAIVVLILFQSVLVGAPAARPVPPEINFYAAASLRDVLQ